MIQIDQIKNNIDNWNFFFKIKSLIKDNENHEKTYENLVKHFFMFHDPTTQDRQGNDRGKMILSFLKLLLVD